MLAMHSSVALFITFKEMMAFGDEDFQWIVLPIIFATAQ